MNEIIHKLKRPFEVSKISWRVGSTNGDKTKGIALAYIDARDVMRRLDDVFGLNWQCKYSHAEAKTICEIGCKINGEWVWRSGGAGDTDIEAEKGAISDAFKRAAVLWGIGQYLYELPNEWVALTPSGRSYKLGSTPSLPSWATPEGYDKIMAGREEKEKKERLPTLSCEEAEKQFNAWMDEKVNYIYEDGTEDESKITAAWKAKPSNVRSAITKFGKGEFEEQQSEVSPEAKAHLNSI